MNTQKSTSHQKSFLNNFASGSWIVIFSGIIYIISLFLVWVTNGFLISKGVSFLAVRTSFASGMPQLNLITLLTVIGCILLSILILNGKKSTKFKRLSITQIILSFLGVLPFILLPFELKTWTPPGHIEFGAWLAIAAALGICFGALWNFLKIRK